MTTYNSTLDSDPRNCFTLSSDEYTVNGITFSITFITERCVVVESPWMTNSQPCRSRASAEKFCELYAPYIQAKINNWAWSMMLYTVCKMQIAQPEPPPSTPQTATIRMQDQMMNATGINNPLRAHDALMAEWLAKHPLKDRKPAATPHSFAPTSKAA